MTASKAARLDAASKLYKETAAPAKKLYNETSREIAKLEGLLSFMADERDSAIERVKELERENAQYRALLLLRKDGRPEWQARMEDAEHECDEARAALRKSVVALAEAIASLEGAGELPSYLNEVVAEARRIFDSGEKP